MKKDFTTDELLTIRRILKKEIESVEVGQKENLEAILEKIEINLNHEILHGR